MRKLVYILVLTAFSVNGQIVDRFTPFNQSPRTDSYGKADVTGLKTWDWSVVNIPASTGVAGDSFANYSLAIAAQCTTSQITKVGDSISFYVDPLNPSPENWCSESYNMRAEIRTNSWPVKSPLGTEEWFGWTYSFGNDYVIDPGSDFLFFQVHNSDPPKSPQISIIVNKTGQYEASAGEIIILNGANAFNNSIYDYNATGIIPTAGKKYEIVVHAVWDLGNKGWMQVWIDGTKYYDKHVDTVYNDGPWGGNAKFGIYKWDWRTGAKVTASVNAGAPHIQTYMGNLKIITKHPDSPNYLKDEYNTVKP